MVKNLPANLGLIPESGRSLGEGNAYPPQYSCLENSMDREAWKATVYGVTKYWTELSELTLWAHPTSRWVLSHSSIDYLRRKILKKRKKLTGRHTLKKKFKESNFRKDKVKTGLGIGLKKRNKWGFVSGSCSCNELIALTFALCSKFLQHTPAS